MKLEMLQVLAEMRKALLDETTDLNTTEVRQAIAQFLNSVEAYVIEKENW